MKRFLLMPVVVGIAGSLFLGCSRQPAGSPVPAPKETISEESEKQKQREEWIEQMHKAAPGTDWRAMDEQAMEELYQSRLPQLQAFARSGKEKSGVIESIADGNLTGQWIEKGSNNMAGRVHCVDVDFRNNKLYAASDGGQVWVGGLEGENWQSISDPYRIDNIQFIRAFQNNSGGTRVLAANHKVRMNYTDDNGTTWIKSDGLSTYYSEYSLLRTVSQADGTLYLLAYRADYLYLFKSTDLGTTFQRMIRMAGSQYSDLWTNRFGKDSLYMVDRNKVYTLVDSVTFQKTSEIPLAFPVTDIKSIQFAGHQAGPVAYLYVLYKLEKVCRFYGMDDDAKTWRARGENSDGPFMSNSFGASTLNPRLIATGGVDAYRSENGGPTWVKVNGWGEYYQNMSGKLHADIPEIEFFRTPDGNELTYISTDGGTFLSRDQMKTVKNVSQNNLNISQYYSTYTHRTRNQVIYAGAQDQGFQRTLESGTGTASFQQTISGDYGHIVSGDGGVSLWTDYPGFAMYYPDAAGSTDAAFWDFTGKEHYWIPPLMADPYSPKVCWLAGGTTTTGSHLWKLEYSNYVITPTELEYDFSGPNKNAWISAMAWSPINRDYRYVLTSEGRLYTSTDQGTTWSRSATRGPDSHYFYGNAIVPSARDINTIYLAGSGYSGSPVWVSHDGGVNFSKMNNGLTNTLIFEMVSNEDGSLLFAASQIAPWVYIKKLDKWFDLSGLAAPQQTWWSVDYVPSMKTARFGTYGRGIWDFKIESFTGIEEIVAAASDIRLKAWPNPCTSRLNFSVNGGKPGDRQVMLFTLEGKIVKTVSGEEDHLDVSGLEQGMYFLKCGSETVKILVSGR